MKIGFALVCNDEFVEKFVELENQVHDYANFFNKLGIKKNLPHTTIFQGDLKDDIDYKLIANQLKEKYLELFPDRIIAFNYVKYIHYGWYFYMCKNDEKYKKLASYALKLVRNYIIHSYEDRMFYTKKETEMYKASGYRYASYAIRPHITIGRTNTYDEDLLKNLKTKFKSIPKITTVSKITVYEMGENGTHKKTLYEVEV